MDGHCYVGGGYPLKSYTYKWIQPSCSPSWTTKIRSTRGTFAGWTGKTGLLKVHYAVFRNRRSELLIPIYDLTAETKERLGKPKPPYLA